MRPQPMLRAGRSLTVGALSFATLATGASALAQAQTTTATIAVANTPRTHLLKGRSVRVHGVLRPAQGGQHVALQARHGEQWVTLDGATTDPAGRYALRYR